MTEPIPDAEITAAPGAAPTPPPPPPVPMMASVPPAPPFGEPVKPRLSRGVWVFGALLVVLLTGLSVLGVVYANNKRAADRATSDQSSRIASLTEETKNQVETISRKEEQIKTSQKSAEELKAHTGRYTTCHKALQDLYDAAVAHDTPGIQAAYFAMTRDCLGVA